MLYSEEQLRIYREIAPHILDKHLRIAEWHFQHAVAVSRWLLTTLIVVNTGAFLIIMQAGQNSERYFRAGGVFFVLGLALALGCALAAYLNWERLSRLQIDLADPRLLHHPDYLPTPSGETHRFVEQTFRAAIALGSLSIAMLTLGAIVIWQSIEPLPG